MALVLCDDHGKPQGGNVKREYVHAVNPIGYPATAALCGRTGCENPGRAWLTQGEYDKYQQGQRVFGVKSNAINLKVE